jgi:flagellar biosynthesis/type III secretory pathway protein FliH
MYAPDTSSSGWAAHANIFPEITALVYPLASPQDSRELSQIPNAIPGSAVPLQFSSIDAVTRQVPDGISLADLEKRIAEESHRSFEAGRQQGFKEGSQVEREAQTAVRSAEDRRRSEQLASLLQKFNEARDNYLHEMEAEVVKLALAIAARVLRRESQMDPLLLTGAVRVALGQLGSTSQVRLRVPALDLDMWTEAMEHMPNLALKPTVVVGEEMRLGDCAIETELGTVDLGIRSQMGEIERGFFDRTNRNESVGNDMQEKHSDRKAR